MMRSLRTSTSLESRGVVVSMVMSWFPIMYLILTHWFHAISITSFRRLVCLLFRPPKSLICRPSIISPLKISCSNFWFLSHVKNSRLLLSGLGMWISETMMVLYVAKRKKIRIKNYELRITNYELRITNVFYQGKNAFFVDMSANSLELLCYLSCFLISLMRFGLQRMDRES